jgi:hypothetical protein
MIEGREVAEIRLLSAQGQPTKAVLAQTCMVVFFIRPVSDTIFEMIFIPKPPADHRWHADHNLKKIHCSTKISGSGGWCMGNASLFSFSAGPILFHYCPITVYLQQDLPYLTLIPRG